MGNYLLSYYSVVKDLVKRVFIKFSLGWIFVVETGKA